VKLAELDMPDVALLALMTDEERARFAVLTNDTPLRVTFADLVIRTKNKQLIPFVPNETQSLYLSMLAETYPGFDPVTGLGLSGIREDVLKSRQQGMSTLWLALYFLDTINTPLTQTICLAHDGDSTAKLFEMVHRFYQGLPPEKKRPLRYSNRKELVFADIDSAIYVGTAGNKSVGRGGTINNIHESERAFWKDGDSVEIGLLQSVPANGNVTRETTANGLNEYYDERQREHSGESSFVPRFFGWNLHSEYRTDFAGNDFIRTDGEENLSRLFNLSPGQLLWRREKMKELKEKFPQEYPLTEREAFLTSGNPVFDRDSLERFEARLKGVNAVGSPRFFAKNARGVRESYARLQTEHSNAKLTIYEEPRDELVYLVTSDPASGVNNDGKRDFISCSVWGFGQYSGLTQVAHLYGHWEPHETAILLAELGYWYKSADYREAMLCPLSLMHGQSVWNTLVHEIGYPQNRGNGWGGLYYHNPSDINERLTDLKPEQRTPGFPEGGGGKQFMVGVAQEMIVSDEVIINSAVMVSQLFRYVHHAGGGMAGEGGSHDDAVSDFCCACAVYRLRGGKAKVSTTGRRVERLPMPPKTFTDSRKARR